MSLLVWLVVPYDFCGFWSLDINTVYKLQFFTYICCCRTAKYRDTLPSSVQKRLNRSTCRLGCGLGWAEGSTSSIVFARWVAPMCSHGSAHLRQPANTIEPFVCDGDAALCQITLTTCSIRHCTITSTIEAVNCQRKIELQEADRTFQRPQTIAV